MTACGLQYRADLEQAEAKGITYLTPMQFRRIATQLGWQGEVIDTLLAAPPYRGSILMKGKAYRLLDVA